MVTITVLDVNEKLKTTHKKGDDDEKAAFCQCSAFGTRNNQLSDVWILLFFHSFFFFWKKYFQALQIALKYEDLNKICGMTKKCK